MKIKVKALSLDEKRDNISRAFRAKFNPSPRGNDVIDFWVMEIFDDDGYLIANDAEKFYRVDYSLKNKDYEFQSRSDWQEVQQKTQWIEKVKSFRLKARTNKAETLIAWGGAVKALGDGKVGGYLVRFSTDDDLDLEGEFFNKETDYGEPKPVPPTGTVYYQHGLDKKMGKRKLGMATHKIDEFGVWAEAQLNLRDEYENFIYAMAEKGKMGWSSGTASHLVERQITAKGTWIKSWPLGLDDTLTPVPAEPRNEAIPLKSWQPEELGVTLAERIEMLNAELKTLDADLSGLVASIDKPLTGTKRKELTELLELCSGLDAVRSDLEQVLAAEPHSKLVTSRLIGYQMAETRKRLEAINLLEE